MKPRCRCPSVPAEERLESTKAGISATGDGRRDRGHGNVEITYR